MSQIKMDWEALASVDKLLDLVRATNSNKEKIALLESHKDMKYLSQVLYYTLNPQLKYSLTKKTLDGLKQSDGDIYDGNPFELCEILAVSNINKKLKQMVKDYICSIPQDCQGIVTGMLLKKQGISVDVKTVNKIFPNLIDTWDVALAEPIKKVKSFKKNEWISVSLKMNGIRSVYCSHSKEFKSRQGFVQESYPHLIKEIEVLLASMKEKRPEIDWDNYVLDGELIHKNRDFAITDEENFRLTSSIVASVDTDKSNIEYVLFDHMPYSEFKDGESKLTFKQRLEILKLIQTTIDELGLEWLRIVPHLYEGVYSKDVIDQQLNRIIELELEGAMVNRDETYKCKRSKDILKVKSFLHADVFVIGAYEGEGQLEGTLGGLIFDYKGNPVKTGSGFSLEQRNEIWNNMDNYCGKIITVKYKAESHNKDDDKVSCQFPIFVCFRFDKNEPSYEI